MLLATVSEAQITSSGLGTMVVPRDGKIFNITGGTRTATSKGNLFHSFGLFSLPTSDTTANFCNATACLPNGVQPLSGVQNILGRITGEQPSDISGKIQTQGFGAANLFLINPTGWIFRPTASLNVGGAFHVSTANHINFPGAQFSSATTADQLSNNGAFSFEPTSFGFLGPSVAGISVDRSNLQVPTGKTLSIVGGKVKIVGEVRSDPGVLRALGGRVQIVSVASAGEVPVNGEFDVRSFASMGQIDISNGALIHANGFRAVGSGTILIRGGRLMVEHSSLRANTRNADGAKLGIDLQVAEDIVLRDGTSVTTQSIPQAPATGTGRAGSILVEARNGSVSVTGGAEIGSESFSDNPGKVGNVTVKAIDGSVGLSGSLSSIFSRSVGATAGTGTIAVDARSVTLTDGGQIQSGSAGGAGGATLVEGGNVTVTAQDSIVISDHRSGIPSAQRSGIFSKSSSQLGGSINISAATLIMDNGLIDTSTQGAGNAGDLLVNARHVTLTRGSSINSSSLLALTTGAGGGLTVTADSVAISGGSGLFSTAEGKAPGGNIDLRARDIGLTDGATITARSTGTTDALAGNVNIVVGDTFRMRNSAITTDAGVADGGDITLTGGHLVYLLNSGITASVAKAKGNGGNITIDPQFVVLDHSQLRADAFGGRGGKITIVSDFFLTNPFANTAADLMRFVSASSALSTQGTISIQSRFTNLSSGVAPLPAGLAQAATLLRASCAARVAAGKASSLVVAGREGAPPEPGGYMSSPLLAPEPGGVEPSRSDGPVAETLPRLSLSVFAPACAR